MTVNSQGTSWHTYLLFLSIFCSFKRYQYNTISILDQLSLYRVRGLSIPKSIIERHWYTYLHTTHPLCCIQVSNPLVVAGCPPRETAMASLSIFDDDRSATPDFFHVQTHDPEVSSICVEAKAFQEPKSLIDHDTNNFRGGLWRFPSNERTCAIDKASLEGEVNTVKAAPPKPALKRWYWRYNSDGTRHQVPLVRKQRLEQAPSHEQVHDGYRVWNISTEHQDEAVNAHQDVHFSSDQPTVKEGYITPPASPTPSLFDLNDWTSRSSSLLINEMISEENRKSVARKQYYDRSGLLWDCASLLLESTLR